MNAIDKINAEIQDIHAKINKMKRLYDDALENLNLSGTVARIQREMDGKYASLEVSANRILMRVGDVEKGLRSELSVTASDITMRVNRKILKEFVTTTNPESDDFKPTDEQKEMLCLYDKKDKEDEYYYYDAYDEKWKKYTGSIGTMFRQSGEGFVLVGNTFIKGDLYAKRLYGTNTDDEKPEKQGEYFVTVNSGWGDFGLFKSDVKENELQISNEQCIWGVMHSDVTTHAVNMWSYGHNFLGYNGEQNKVWAKGNWSFCAVPDSKSCVVDFSGCTEVKGLGVVPVFG